MTEQDVVAAQGNLWASIKNYVPSTGEPWTPSEDLRQAFFACPRHQFCHAFSLADRSASYNADDWASRADWLPQVYRNSTLVYLDDGGKPLPSTTSEPAFILYLVSLLDVRAGQRVLEIGSGGGWLVSMLGRLVGADGHATGMEPTPLLAKRSQADLEKLGIENVAIVCDDASRGVVRGPPFDRIIATAAAPSLPFHLRDQLADGGVLVAPVQVPGGGDEVLVLRRQGGSLISSKCIQGWVVLPRGEDAAQPAPADLAGSALWKKIGRRECAHHPWSAVPPGVSFAHATQGFRAFLNRLGARLEVVVLPSELRRPGGATLGFGLTSDVEGSAVLCYDRQIVGFGSDVEINRFLRWRSIWFDLGCPMSEHFALRAVPASAGQATLRPDEWLGERTEAYQLIWSVKPPRPEGLPRLIQEARRAA